MKIADVGLPDLAPSACEEGLNPVPVIVLIVGSGYGLLISTQNTHPRRWSIDHEP